MQPAVSPFSSHKTFSIYTYILYIHYFIVFLNKLQYLSPPPPREKAYNEKAASSRRINQLLRGKKEEKVFSDTFLNRYKR